MNSDKRIGHCSVCLGVHVGPAYRKKSIDFTDEIDCLACGKYLCTMEAHDVLKPDSAEKWLTPLVRSGLSYRIRNDIGLPHHKDRLKLPMLTADYVERMRSLDYVLPSANEQCANILRYLDEREKLDGGEAQTIHPASYALFGCISPTIAKARIKDLVSEGLIHANFPSSGAVAIAANAVLSLSGHRELSELNKGHRPTKQGIIAMSFGDSNINDFVEEIVKPAIASIDGFRLVRVDDLEVSRAGVIDNIMRNLIRDSAFLLADLSNDNLGAYWEAGYAEGLGKPVIYLCHRDHWEERKTHFDVNHCSTVFWGGDDDQDFERQLVAMVRNSLGI